MGSGKAMVGTQQFWLKGYSCICRRDWTTMSITAICEANNRFIFEQQPLLPLCLVKRTVSALDSSITATA